jgi:hypothetical protein
MVMNFFCAGKDTRINQPQKSGFQDASDAFTEVNYTRKVSLIKRAKP